MQTMFLLSHKFARYMRALTGSERTKHCFGLPAHAGKRVTFADLADELAWRYAPESYE